MTETSSIELNWHNDSRTNRIRWRNRSKRWSGSGEKLGKSGNTSTFLADFFFTDLFNGLFCFALLLNHLLLILRQRGRKTNNENLLKAVASRRTKLGLDDKPWSYNRVGLERAGGHKFKFSYGTIGEAMEQLQVENKDGNITKMNISTEMNCFKSSLWKAVIFKGVQVKCLI